MNSNEIDILSGVVELVESVFRYDMSTDKLHWWILIGGLLTQYGTRKNRVVAVILTNIDFDLN